MKVSILKSKIHCGRLTDACIDYEGSIAISRELMDAAGLMPYEQVLVANVENGSRLWTYVIKESEPGQLVLNGAAAHHGKKGDRVIIMSFATMKPDESAYFKPSVIYPDENNKL